LLECLPHGPGDLIGSCGLVGLSEQRIDGGGGHVVGGFRSELLEHLDRRPVGDPFSVREAATADDGCVDIGEELCGKLAAEQQAAGESKRRTEELEEQLRERNQRLEHAKTGLEQHAADRARLESELGEQLEVAKAAAKKAEAACREEAKRSKQFEEELGGLQKQREELSGKLTTAEQAAGESKRRSEELEKRLCESTGETERVKTEQARLESELGGQLKAAKATAAKAEAACREEAKRSKRFEEELGTLQKQGEELSGKLAAVQQAAAAK